MISITSLIYSRTVHKSYHINQEQVGPSTVKRDVVSTPIWVSYVSIITIILLGAYFTRYIVLRRRIRAANAAGLEYLPLRDAERLIINSTTPLAPVRTLKQQQEIERERQNELEVRVGNSSKQGQKRRPSPYLGKGTPLGAVLGGVGKSL